MNNPLISVIIPIFNVEPYLEQCLQSVINQTLKDIEIILIDDESPDRCPQICDNYAQKDSRIKVIHKKNEGLGFARNSGIKIAKGKYITFLDSDDYIDLDTYSSLFTYATKEDLDILYFCYDRFSSNDITPKKHDYTGKLIIHREKDEIENFMLNMIAARPSEKKDREIQMSACCAIYRKDIIINHNISFPSERELISEDLIFNIDILSKSSSIGCIPHTYYHYRFNPESLTKTIRLDRVEKNEQLYRYLSQRFKDNQEAIVRSMRLFIGDARFAMIQVCKSSLSQKEKYQWLRNTCKKSIWKEIYQKYPYRQMPFKHKLFFICSVYKILYPILILSNLKK